MRLPGSKKAITDDAINIAKQCMSDQQDRMDQYVRWRNYTYAGSPDAAKPAILNKVGTHIDRLSSQLFSPSEARFLVEFGVAAPKEWQDREYFISRLLSEEYHGCDADLIFGEGVFWALAYGACLTKTLWSVGKDEHGLDHGGEPAPHLVMPYQFGVWRPDINGLDRQEAICNVNYIGRAELWRRIKHLPDAGSIMKRVNEIQRDRTEDDIDNIVHQVIIGGIVPVTQGTASGVKGNVDVFNFISLPQISQEAARDLVRLVELWIKDDDTGDYTTIQFVDPDILIEPSDQKRNIFMPGYQPFRLIQPNVQRGLFWGRSEIADLQLMQDVLAGRIDDVNHIWKLRAQPPRGLSGFTQLTDEARAAFSTPNGLVMNENPNAKIESLAPELPPESFQQIESVIRWFDDTAGFPAMMRGEGEPGVRSNMQTDNLQRVASARLRDRALIVERQCAEQGSLLLALMREKTATGYPIAPGSQENFVLDQMPDDVKVTVDSHSASPAFSNDNRQMYFALAKAGAIGPRGLLRAMHPPQVDMLLDELDKKEKAQAEMIKQHPELLDKHKRSHH